MGFEKRYRVPLLAGVRRKRLVLGVAFALPLLIAGTLAPAFPESKSLIVGIAVTASILLLSVLGLLMWLSTSFVLGVDKVVKWGVLRPGPELAFDSVASVVTVPVGSHGDAATLLFADDLSADPYRPPSSGGISGLSAAVKKWLALVLTPPESAPKLRVPSYTDQYPELVAEISQRARNALVDPFTRMVAGFASHYSTLDRDYGRRIGARSFPVLSELESARLHASRFELDEALNHLQRLVAADPHDANAWHLLGVVQFLRRQTEEAEQALEEAAVLQPKDAGIRSHLGIAKFYGGKFKKARDEFQRSLELTPDDPAIASFFGCANSRIGKWDDGISTFRRLESHPTAARGVQKCLDCTADVKELVDQGKASAAARRAKAIGYLALALVGIGAVAEFLLRGVEGRGLLVTLLVLLIGAAVSYGKYHLERLTSPEIRGPVPCWLNLGWMKRQLALAGAFGIDQADAESGETGADNASDPGRTSIWT